MTDLGVMPTRDGQAYAAAARRSGEATERRRQRPKDAGKQVQHYSGKKKAHSDKNLVVVQTRSKHVGYLGPT